ncbi:immunoglobulin-like domain-containing protein [Oceanirhabdus seepicola]|uniref:DUF5011 domain-containing protein n=1 Tax=Oceanirhabdus seepicola TaxID=2828781 RepID=A0A9J6NVK0_9CLOT|nr:immunoglobulin-like domain-containing protein [Oceanirhabdus seepicola]MCM1988490.1 DUF5011 domain-containing protein [Oceanirhabdus seepicola]
MKKRRFFAVMILAMFIFQLMPFQEFTGFFGNQIIIHASPISGMEDRNFINIVKKTSLVPAEAVGEFSADTFLGFYSNSNGDRPKRGWRLVGRFDFGSLESDIADLAKKGDLQFRVGAEGWVDGNDTVYCYAKSLVVKDGKPLLVEERKDFESSKGMNFTYDSGWRSYYSNSLYNEIEFYADHDRRNYSQITKMKLKFQDVGSPGLQNIEVSGGKYGIGKSIDIKMRFDEPVRVDTNTEIPMNADTREKAKYHEGNGTKVITFRYVVQKNDVVKGNSLNISGQLSSHLSKLVQDLSGNKLDINDWKSEYDINYNYDSTCSHYYNELETKSVQLDGIRPEVTNVTTSITSQKQVEDKKYMKAGDALTITVTTDDIVFGTNGFINLNNGKRATYKSGSGTKTITYEYIVQAGDNNTNHLSYSGFVNNLDIKDDYGNHVAVQNGINVSLSYNDNAICVDTTKPRVNFLPNGNTTYEKAQTAKIQVVETGSGLKGDLLKAIWTDSNQYPTNWDSAQVLPYSNPEVSYANDTGDWYVHVAMEDRAGNKSGAITSPAFKLDNKVPEFQIQPNGNEKYLGTLTPNGIITDEHSGVNDSTAEYQWQHESQSDIMDNMWKKFTNRKGVRTPEDPQHGKYILHLRGEDIAGNKSQGKSDKPFHLDKLGPVISMVEDENMDSKRKHVVRILANDEHSEMKRMAYYWSKSPVARPSSDTKWVDTDYYEVLIKSKDWPEKMGGIWHLHVLAVDEWDNETTEYMSFKIDNAAPDIDFKYPVVITSVVKEGEVKVDVKDDNDITGMFYQWTQSETAPDTNDANWRTFNSGDILKKSNVNGEWYLHIKAKDYFNNEVIVASRRIDVDNTKPNTENYHITSNYHFNKPVANVEIKTNDYEKVKFYIKDTDDKVVKHGTMASDTVNVLFNLPNTEGEYKYYFSFEDELGNMSDKVEKTFTYDATPPEAKLGFSESNLTKNDVIVSLSDVSDNFTSSDIIETPKGNKKVFRENGRYTFRVVDKAGNEKDITANVDWIDKLAPNVEIVPVIENAENLMLRTASPIIATNNNKAEVIVTDNVTRAEDIIIYYQWGQDTNRPSSEDENWVLTTNNAILTNLDSHEGISYLYIKAIDGVGNEYIARSSEFIVDNSVPIPEITYSTSDKTANGIIAKITFDELGVRIIKPESGLNYHEFKENGSFTFEFEDSAGNRGAAKATVENIDPSLPKAEVSFSTKELTNENVQITISTEKLPGYYLEEFKFDNGMNERLISKFEEIEVKTSSEKELAPNEEEKTSSEKELAPNEEEKISSEEELAPNEEEKISSEEELAPSEEEKTSSEEELAPSEEEKTSSEKELAPNEEEKISSEEELAPSEEEKTSSEEELAPSEEEKTSSEEKLAPSEEEKTSSEKELTPSEEEKTSSEEAATNTEFNEINGESIGNSKKIIKAIYEVSNNGKISFLLRDDDDTTEDQPVTVEINNIVKAIEGATIKYSTTAWTKGPVIAKLIINDLISVEITNNDGKDKYKFTENGDFEFTFKDAVGNQSTATARVRNIDKEAPTATADYSETEKTKENVTVTITPEDNSKEEVTILNNNGSNTYTFIENGSFTFKLRDKAGNESDYRVEVNNIDTEKPKAFITYNPTEYTKDDVVATINFTDIIQEPVTITNNQGKKEYTFTENGIFTFNFVDGAGNQGNLTAIVDWIDKTAPVGAVQPSETKPTKNDVLLTLITEEGTRILNNEGKNTILATNNGIYTFKIADKLGNHVDITYEVTNIDRQAPNAKVYYNTKELTNKDVIATVSADEPIEVLYGGSKDYIFKDNGEFTFKVVDLAGNEAEAHAKVSNIDKRAPIITVSYSTKELTKEAVKVTISGDEELNILNNNGSNSFSFTKNGYYGFVVEDLAGNRVRTNAQVKNIDFIAPTIEFENPYLIYLLGEEPNMNDFIAYDDKDGLLTSKVSIDTNKLDMDKAGDYEVIYRVSDTAGNETEKRRSIKVLSPTELLVYVNGQINEKNEYIIDDSKIELKMFGVIENYEIRHKSGGELLRSGDMKIGCDSIEGQDNLRVIYYESNEIGWQTFYIQDQNRRTSKINVFFLRSK